jgi:hypothetical protein
MTSHSTHLIGADRVLARSHTSLIAEKQPGMALQNLHPRFNSGRRLQIFPKENAQRRNSGSGVLIKTGLIRGLWKNGA